MTLKLLPAAALLAATFVIGSGVAHADTNRRDIQAMNNAKLSLAQAIEAAEKQGQGRAIEAGFEAKDGTGQYEIKVLSQDKLTKYKLDANTGQVRETENEPIERHLTRLKPQDLQSAQVTLTQAIATAEQRVGGKAIDAEVEREADRVEYEVTVARTDGTTQKAKINGVNGQVTSVEND